MTRGKAPTPPESLAIVRTMGDAITRVPTSAQTVLDTFFGAQSPATVRTYREALGFFAKWLSGVEHQELDVNATAALIFKWDSATAHLRALAYTQFMQHRKLSPNTINLRLAALRSLIKLGQQLGAITWRLETQGVRPGLVKDVRGPSLERVKKVLVDARAAGPRTYALTLLLFERGLRSIEARELKLEHLSLSDSPPFIMVRGKGNAGLTPLTVSPVLASALSTWLGHREFMLLSKAQRAKLRRDIDDPAQLVIGPPYTPGFVFFPERFCDPQRPLTKWAVWDTVRKVGLSSDVKLWPHALRHSALTAMLDATNGNVRDVMQFSRHKNLQTLMKYDDRRKDIGGQMTNQLSELTKGGK